MEEAFDVVAEISEVFVVPYACVHNCSSLASSVSQRPNGSAIALFTPTRPTN